jgi:uncharacterized membrane-anchored protein YhcB (DUF1043 family)
MTDNHSPAVNEQIGATLTPDEESYFESGGATDIPVSESGEATDREEGHGLGEDGSEGGQPNQPNPSKAERMVSLAALHEERSRRKEIDRHNRVLQQQVAELRGKFSVIERLNAPAPDKPPTIEEDMAGVVRNTTETVAQLQKRMEQRDTQERAAHQQNALVSAYRADAAQFESRIPDFKAAYDHLLQSRAQELLALGYDNPQAIHEALLADEFAVAQSALMTRRSPAEVIYNLARQRGYAKGAGGRGNAAARLDTIERGQYANKSLSNTGGSSGDGEIGAEALLKMPMDEFEAWCAKNPSRAKRLMGG